MFSLNLPAEKEPIITTIITLIKLNNVWKRVVSSMRRQLPNLQQNTQFSLILSIDGWLGLNEFNSFQLNGKFIRAHTECQQLVAKSSLLTSYYDGYSL